MLIQKFSNEDKAQVDRLFQTLEAIQDDKLKLQCIVQLVKVNKAADLGDRLLEVVRSNASGELCGKLVLFSLLKMPKKT